MRRQSGIFIRGVLKGPLKPSVVVAEQRFFKGKKEPQHTAFTLWLRLEFPLNGFRLK